MLNSYRHNLLKNNLKIRVVLVVLNPAGKDKQTLTFVNSLIVVVLVDTTVGKLGIRG
jgi:hypothetical protein